MDFALLILLLLYSSSNFSLASYNIDYNVILLKKEIQCILAGSFSGPV